MENMNENGDGDSKDVKGGRIEIDGHQDRVGIVNREKSETQKVRNAIRKLYKEATSADAESKLNWGSKPGYIIDQEVWYK